MAWLGEIEMTIGSMIKKPATVALVLGAALTLSACTGGTTYGTGVSHEKQTLSDLSNILSVQRKSGPKIEYSARPDLVVPENRDQLVEPVEEGATTSEMDWPESPDERLARIRSEAEEAETSIVSQLEYNKRQKRFGPQVTTDIKQEAPVGFGVPNVSCDPGGSSMRKCTPQEISRAVRETREEIKSVGTTGRARRYLTEPPIEYRTPAQTAEAGDLGYTEEELAEIEREKKLKEQRESMGPVIR